MIIEKSLNPNCSEAVIRFNIDKLTKKQSLELYKELEKAVEKYGYDTYLFEKSIFGVNCFVVQGDMPYNDGDTLLTIAGKHNVPTEYDE